MGFLGLSKGRKERARRKGGEREKERERERIMF